MKATTRNFLFLARLIERLVATGSINDPQLIFAAHRFFVFNDAEPLHALVKEYPDLVDELVLRSQREKEGLEDHAFSNFPTPEDVARFNQGATIRLGKVNPQGSILGMSHNYLQRNMVLTGGSGTGKTTWLYVLVSELCRVSEQLKAKGEEGFNILIFDVKGDFCHLARHLPSFKVIQQHQIRENIFEPVEGESWEDALNRAIPGFCADNYGLDLTERALLAPARGLYRDMGSISGVPVWPNFSDLRRAFSAWISTQTKGNQGGSQFKDIQKKTEVRLDDYCECPMLNTRLSLPLEMYMKENLVVELSGLRKYQRNTYIMSVLRKIFKFRRDNNIRGSELRTVCLFDEGYYLFSSVDEKNSFKDTEYIEEFLLQAREFGFASLVAAQRADSLSSILKDNSGTRATFKVFAEAAKACKDMLGLTKDQADYLVNQMPSTFTGLIKIPSVTRPLLFNFKPVFIDKDMEAEEKAETSAEILAPVLSGIDKFNAMVESWAAANDPEKKTKAEIKKEAELHYDGKLIMGFLYKNPFLFQKELKDKTGFTDPRFKAAINLLIQRKQVKQIECVNSGNGKSAFFYPVLIKPKIAPERFKHTFYIHRIYEWLLEKGHNPIKEYSPEKTAFGAKRIDVAGFEEGVMSAYEVTLSMSNLVDNVEKCLAMNTHAIHIVCENGPGRAKAEKIIKKGYGKAPLEVQFTLVSKFMG